MIAPNELVEMAKMAIDDARRFGSNADASTMTAIRIMREIYPILSLQDAADVVKQAREERFQEFAKAFSVVRAAK